MFKPMVDKPARERAVVAAALRLIAQEGDAAMTVRRVAAEAKIPMSSLYELFASQDAVWAAVMREVEGRISRRIEALPAEPSDRQWGRAALRALLPLNPQRRQEVIAAVYIGALGVHNPALHAAWQLVDDAVRATCRRALGAMGLDGGPAQLDQLHSVIDGLARQMVMHADDRSPDWAVAVLDRMLPR
ncbi:TetR/AcrR family transcriptional regulator [Brachybacterium sp. UNK5269]|uniref:TetR/AcrR family transcriptional regulator n=1 Tax=Brachybacterium sp. UNK5269 TaxID=3408576 RepID=UPI003BAF02B9